MKKYIIKIPAYEIEVEATDELDAYARAVDMIQFEDISIMVQEDY